MRILLDKRFLFCLIFVGIIGFKFWTGSRYPELNAKAAMGAVSDLQTLGLGAAWSVEPEDGAWMRIAKGTVNWLHANKRGMKFGLLLAAGVMTALALFPRRNFKSRYANTLAGFALGSPLGVCVNCATPIMRGMHAGGSCLEMSLATMFSSPTFNVVVISMIFTLFPWHFAVVKIVFSLLLILVCVPLAGRVWQGRIKGEKLAETPCDPVKPAEPRPGWWSSIWWFGKNLGRNLLVICVLTVPFMVAAGFLGSVVNEFVPTENILNQLATHGILATVGVMFVVAAVGTFLPVPMAMDVILAASLYAAGLPAKYVMPVLFTTGIYSILAFLVIYRDMSKSLAVAIFATVMGMGVASGVCAHYLDKANESWLEKDLLTNFAESSETPAPVAPPGPEGKPLAALRAELDPFRTVWVPVEKSSNAGRVTVEQAAFGGTEKTEGERIFENHLASEIGVDSPFVITTDRLVEYRPLHGRPVASGDVHGDGWPDLVIANDFYAGGLTLFSNLHGDRFVAQEVNLGSLAKETVVLTALVDLDNDSWLDLFFGTFRQGSYWIRNQEGAFTGEPVQVNRRKYSLLGAAAFADLNRDGQLDAVLGNWTIGWSVAIRKGWGPESSRNEVLLSRPGGGHDLQVLQGPPAETLSILVSDIDQDGWSDILVGNDYDEPDSYYPGSAELNLTPASKDQCPIPVTPYFNMCYEVGDLNNDLRPELFSVNISGGGLGRERKVGKSREKMAMELPGRELREQHLRLAKLQPMFRYSSNANSLKGQLDWNDRERQNSFGYFVFSHVAVNSDFDHYLDYIPRSRADMSWHVERMRMPNYQPTEEEKEKQIPQVRDRNVLLSMGEGGDFAEVTEEWGVKYTGWTWNAQFVDFDLDGWQDLFCVNGMSGQSLHEPNHLFLNQGGDGFNEVTEAQGVGTYLETMSFTQSDFDLDGDVDLIVVPLMGPVEWHKNLSAGRANSLSVELADEAGNHFGIGAQVIIRYPGGQQIREIKASGGYLSFNAPIANFGLGDVKEVERIEVRWPDGEETVLEGPFPAGHRYRLHRAAP